MVVLSYSEDQLQACDSEQVFNEDIDFESSNESFQNDSLSQEEHEEVLLQDVFGS